MQIDGDMIIDLMQENGSVPTVLDVDNPEYESVKFSESDRKGFMPSSLHTDTPST